MEFRSDNVAPVHPRIMEAMVAANSGAVTSYGADDLTARLEETVASLFEHEVAVFPVMTGSAANALALSVLTPPWGAVFCHAQAHINTDECGAPEFFTNGAKLIPLPGEDAKLTPETLADGLKTVPQKVVHHVQASAVSVTQATEFGAVYTPDEIAALSAVAKNAGMAMHMDGARFANALSRLGCAPADVTWRAGIDMLSLGATKNGAMVGELVVAFDRAHAEALGYRRKRAGHLASKMRFFSAQLLAWLENGLWLDLAAHANAMADRLSHGLGGLPDVRLIGASQSNEIFARVPVAMVATLKSAGARFYEWGQPDDPPGFQTVRLVTSFATEDAEIQAFLEAARKSAAAGR